ncbi:hypothetical protein ACFYRL_13980 [Streptomyces goshikiensis]|uniref:hypothetical protein n=1 Tax=Streptomyces goshikiensis TaxID=1942 RepID=UPI0036951169
MIRARAYGAGGGEAGTGLAGAGKGGPYGEEAYTPAGADGTTPAGGEAGTGGNIQTSALHCEDERPLVKSSGSAGAVAQGDRGGIGGDAGKDPDPTDT